MVVAPVEGAAGAVRAVLGPPAGLGPRAGLAPRVVRAPPVVHPESAVQAAQQVSAEAREAGQVATLAAVEPPERARWMVPSEAPDPAETAVLRDAAGRAEEAAAMPASMERAVAVAPEDHPAATVVRSRAPAAVPPRPP
jgi:hypothetical protein